MKSIIHLLTTKKNSSFYSPRILLFLNNKKYNTKNIWPMKSPQYKIKKYKPVSGRHSSAFCIVGTKGQISREVLTKDSVDLTIYFMSLLRMFNVHNYVSDLKVSEHQANCPPVKGNLQNTLKWDSTALCWKYGKAPFLNSG